MTKKIEERRKKEEKKEEEVDVKKAEGCGCSEFNF